MQRICPNCSKDLGTLGNYFCCYCGKELPSQLIGGTVRVDSGLSEPPPFIIKESFNYKILVPVTISVVGVALFISLALLLMPFLKRGPTPESKAPVVNEGVVQTDLNLPSFAFSEDSGLTHIVPGDVDLFVEGGNFSAFMSEITGLPKEASMPMLPMRSGDFTNLVQDRFVLFSRSAAASADTKRVWVFAAKIKNESSARLLEQNSREATWSARVLDDVLLVSNSPKIFSEIQAVKKKQVLDLSLNAKFVTEKGTLPKEGKLLVYISTASASQALKDASRYPLISSKLGKSIDILLAKGKNGYVLK